MARTAIAGQMLATINDTAVPVGANLYRVVARVATNAPGAGATLTLTGKVEVIAK